MVKTKNPTQSVELRLSVNLSMDDVGLTRLYQELRAIEVDASGLASIQIHTLKRRHLLKILHTYCANAFEPSRLSSDTDSAKLARNWSSADKAIVTQTTQPTSLLVTEVISPEQPTPRINSEADRALQSSGFGFQSHA
jgi:hypothetical protein